MYILKIRIRMNERTRQGQGENVVEEICNMCAYVEVVALLLWLLKLLQ